MYMYMYIYNIAFVFAQLGDVTNTGEEGAEFDTLNTLIFNEWALYVYRYIDR